MREGVNSFFLLEGGGEGVACFHLGAMLCSKGGDHYQHQTLLQRFYVELSDEQLLCVEGSISSNHTDRGLRYFIIAVADEGQAGALWSALKSSYVPVRRMT